MRVRGLWVFLLAGCTVDSLGVERLRFACTSDDDCLAGWVCRQECVRADSIATTDGGTDAGTTDAGAEADAGSNGLRFADLPASALAGTCVALTLEASRALTVDQAVDLTVSPLGAARFSNDSACTSTVANATLGANATQVTVFLKTRTGGRVTLGASAVVGTALQAFNVTPAVRRGVCLLPAAGPPLPDGGAGAPGLTRTCSVSPPVNDLTHSFVVAQATTTGQQLTGSAQVHCRLASTSTLECTRSQDSDDADIRFQVIELPAGAQTATATATDCTFPLPLDAGFELTNAFLLRTTAGTSTYFDDDDTPVFSFDAGLVVLEPPRCDLATAQAVWLEGVTVTRGVVDAGATLAQTFTATGLPTTGPNTALLTQTYTPDGIHDVCSLLVRASLPSSTSIALSRGAGVATCAPVEFPLVAYERIDFGARAQVQERTVSLATLEPSDTVTIAAVDLSRTMVIASNQSISGQGMGESGLADPRLYASGLASFELVSPTSVRVTRGLDSSSASFTFYVVELNP